MHDLRYWLLLQSIDGIGPIFFKALVNKFSDPKLVFNAEPEELLAIPRVNRKIVDQIINKKNTLENIEILIEQLSEREIKTITYQNDDYPDALKDISNAPPIIYLWGDMPKGKSIGIIGTRDASEQGIKKATEYAIALSKAGYVIVSGYAKGIDTAAHLGAIQAKAKTLAILPTGILKFKLHQELSDVSDEFTNQATLLSEFYPLSEWSVGNALLRNRITSAFSDKILVIESGDSGGTLSTCEYAKAQRKPIFLYDGIQSSMDKKILELGAVPITSIDKLLDL